MIFNLILIERTFWFLAERMQMFLFGGLQQRNEIKINKEMSWSI